VLNDGKTVGAVARDMDLTETAVREWVKRARADRTHGRTGLATAEREELPRLRKENRAPRTGRDILKKSRRPSSRSTSSKVCLLGDLYGDGRQDRFLDTPGC
jgi:transposase